MEFNEKKGIRYLSDFNKDLNFPITIRRETEFVGTW